MTNTPQNALGPATRKVREIVRRLEEVRADLLDVITGLPLPASMNDRTELRRLSEVSEVDALVRCALHDHFDPLVVSLRNVAQVRRRQRAGEPHRSRRRSHGE